MGAPNVGDFQFWNGSFECTWKPPETGVAIPVGTTERGIRFAARPRSLPITEDRFGDAVVDELYMGHETPLVTIESLNWVTGTNIHPLLYALCSMAGHNPVANTFLGAGAGPQTFGVPWQQYGRDIPASMEASTYGTLECTAVTGRMAGDGGGPTKITFHNAYPIEPVDLLLSLRGPVKIPFGFRVWPRWDGDADAWKYFTVDVWEGTVGA